MRAYRVVWVLMGLILVSSRSFAVQGKEKGVQRAKAYLAEVEKHLTESYIEREKVKRDALRRSAMKGLLEAVDGKELSGLDAKAKQELREAIKKEESVAKALDACAEVADEVDIDWLLFADYAARAMVKGVGDPYARILTREDFTKLLKILQGGQREDSIGIAVQPIEKGFTVAYVQYGYIAYDAGVEMGDEITQINGEAIAGRSTEEVNERLKVKPGQRITLTVRKPGHPAAYEFALVQRRERARDVHFEMLGEGIGYLRLTIFDLALSGEVKKALRTMKEQGMRALIVDLRHNPGGALPAATAVADQFLPQGLKITAVEMHYKPKLFGFEIPGLGGDQDFTTKAKGDCEELPMRLLVNHASASASELLAGALQDHKRAKVIGETTYGKGVGQSPILLPSSGGGLLPERFLYLTVLRYSLPSGRSIDHKGVVPDVTYPARTVTPEKFAQLWAVRTSDALARYLDAHWGKHKTTFTALARYDGFEISRYPDFEGFYTGLKTTLSRDEVREEVRRAIRARLKAEDGIQFVHDLQTDAQLQFALVDVLESR